MDPSELLQISEDMREPLTKYLQYKQVVNRYERGKHAKVAEIGGRITPSKGDKLRSSAEIERLSLGSSDYRKYLEEWNEYEKEMIKWQIKYDTLRNRYDALVSYFAYQRESMRRLG